MICPKCHCDNVTPVGNSHYVCNNVNCKDENGSQTQFRFVEDEKINFPYNVIYRDRPKSSFFRKPYLEIDKLTK